MPRPKGETHHSASISEATAQELKLTLAAGASVSAVSRESGVPYQTVYRLARGETWAQVPPAGAVLQDGSRATRGPRRHIDLAAWYSMWQQRQAGVAVTSLAEQANLSQSSVRRLVAEFELMIAERVAQLQLTAGSYEPAKRKYGIRRGEAERLDRKATENKLPDRLQRIVDTDFPGLERQLEKE